MVFDAISFYIDEVLSINPSGNVFVYGYFNVHHKDWLTSSGENDRTDEPCYNFSTSHDLNQMCNFRTRIPDCDFHCPVYFDLFLMLIFVLCFSLLLGKSTYVVVSISIDFPSKSKTDTPFHCTVYGYSRDDWDSFCDHLRDDLWEDIFKLVGSGTGN